MGEERKKSIRHFRDLDVYQRAFAAAREIINMWNAMDMKSDTFCYGGPNVKS
jgi:hypothetical protein